MTVKTRIHEQFFCDDIRRTLSGQGANINVHHANECNHGCLAYEKDILLVTPPIFPQQHLKQISRIN